MILSINYNQALNLAFPKRKPYQRAFLNLERLALLLKKNGVQFKVHLDAISFNQIKTPSILCIKLRKTHRYGHAVILNKNKIIDPMRNGRHSLKYCQKNVYAIIEIIKP
jgi:hypothetical protein